MDLDLKERLILAMQCRILENVVEDEGEVRSFREAREALERGYGLHYSDLAEWFTEDEDCMSPADCSEVLDILTMHDVMQNSLRQAGGAGAIDPEDLRFLGFDGNNESGQMGYARWFIRHDGGRFQGLDMKDDLNSHAPSLPRYRRMLRVWQEMKTHGAALSVGQIKSILEAGRRHGALG